MTTTHKTTIKSVLALMALGALVACETVEGAGRDIQGAGQTITTESQQTQADLQD